MPAHELAVLFLVDHSASISPKAQTAARHFIRACLPQQRADDRAGIVGFAGEAAVWQSPVPHLQLDEKWPELTARNRTDLSHALVFASAIFPPQTAKRLVLLSDGQDTAGRLWKPRKAGAERD